MLVSSLSMAAEDEEACHRAAQHEDGRVDPGAHEKREHGRRDGDPRPGRQGAPGQADGTGKEQADSDRREPALDRLPPTPPFEPSPETARREREQARRAEERADDGEGADHAGNPLPDRRDHHHVGPGGHLAEAVEMDELGGGEPVVHVDGQVLELRKCRQAPANGQERQVREDPDEGRDLGHRSAGGNGTARGLCHQTARAPTTTSTTRTGRWSRFTPMTASATKPRSSIRVRTLRPSCTATAMTSPTAAAATP